jgi:hypothetical protein
LVVAVAMENYRVLPLLPTVCQGKYKGDFFAESDSVFAYVGSTKLNALPVRYQSKPVWLVEQMLV